MKIYAIAASAAIASLMLAGCQTTQPGGTSSVSVPSLVARFNAAAAQDVPAACALEASTYASFATAAAVSGPVAKYASTAAKAHAAAAAICANPGSVTAASALQTLANGYVAYMQAMQAK